MAALAQYQRDAVERARVALTQSHQMSLGTATDQDLCRGIGRLEIALEDVLRVIDAVTQ